MRINGYILSLLCGCMICAVVDHLTKQKTTCSAVIKVMCGIFLMITVLAPVRGFSLGELFPSWEEIETQSQQIALSGQLQAKQEMSDIITGEIQAYIQTKAKQLGFEAAVVVTVSDQLSPEAVTIDCACTPLEKKRLQQIIVSDLGIPEERQIWK